MIFLFFHINKKIRCVEMSTRVNKKVKMTPVQPDVTTSETPAVVTLKSKLSYNPVWKGIPIENSDWVFVIRSMRGQDYGMYPIIYAVKSKNFEMISKLMTEFAAMKKPLYVCELVFTTNVTYNQFVPSIFDLNDSRDIKTVLSDDELKLVRMSKDKHFINFDTAIAHMNNINK